MFADLNSELSKIADIYLGHEAEASRKEGFVRKKYVGEPRYFYQLVYELLDYTNDYMEENDIHDTTDCTEIVQLTLEQYVRTITEA